MTGKVLATRDYTDFPPPEIKAGSVALGHGSMMEKLGSGAKHCGLLCSAISERACRGQTGP